MGIDQKKGIQIENLKIKYGKFTVIQDFNLAINKGEILTLFGPSGCGKSTILKAVLNQIPLASGSILIDGINVKDFSLPLAYTPQANELLPWKTVKENIEFWYNDTIQYIHENSIKPIDVIQTVELSQQIDFMPSQLSGGMERRTALARCMCTNSEFMFLDEAFVAVERRLRRKLMVDIRNAIKSNNMTALIISHDYEEAVFMSDRIIKLSANPTTILKSHTVNLPLDRKIDIFDKPIFEKEILEVVI
jgi:NitT/TauT family transport system ATP-binding protein